MSQSLKGSFIESSANIVVGFAINFIANAIFFPMFGFKTFTLETNFELGIIYTVISLLRSFALRRVFNRIRSHHVAD